MTGAGSGLGGPRLDIFLARGTSPTGTGTGTGTGSLVVENSFYVVKA